MGCFTVTRGFIRIIDSMFSPARQVAQGCLELPSPGISSSLNYLLTSHVWQQDHNGFTHQIPVSSTTSSIKPISSRYCRLTRTVCWSVFDHCLPQPELCQCGSGGKTRPSAMVDHGRRHCALHGGQSASGHGPATTQGTEPDVVMACCGDTPRWRSWPQFPSFRQNLPRSEKSG